MATKFIKKTSKLKNPKPTKSATAANYIASGRGAVNIPKSMYNPASELDRAKLLAKAQTSATDRALYNVVYGSTPYKGAVAAIAPSTPKKTTAPSGGNPSGGSPGGGGGSTAVSAPPPKIYTAAELAQMYGIDYDTDNILALLNKGTTAKRDEVLGQIQRDQETSLRTGQGMFSQYLDAMRKSKSNAVATGISKGTQAAQELMAMLGAQGMAAEEQTRLNMENKKTHDEFASMVGANEALARDKSDALKQYLGTLSSGLNANDVQRYAADLAARAASAGSSGGGGGSYSYGGSSGGSGSAENQEIELYKFLLRQGMPPNKLWANK